MAKLISKVYGDALFEAAMDKKDLEAVYEEARALSGIFRENPELMDALNHPQIVKEEKISVMEKIFLGKVSDEMMGFLTIIVDKGRQRDIPAIFIILFRQSGNTKRLEWLPLPVRCICGKSRRLR